MPEPERERRRRRPAVSCTLCRRRKIRCNKQNPCSNCLRSKSGQCVYDNPPPPPPGPPQPRHDQVAQVADHQKAVYSHHSTPGQLASNHGSSSASGSCQVTSVAGPSTSATTISSQPPSQDVEFMRNRIRELEEKLSHANSKESQVQPPTSTATIETVTTGLTGPFHLRHETEQLGKAQASSYTVVHKSRLFGQSHWINGMVMIKDVIEAIESTIRDGTSNITVTLGKCKALARVIKTSRTPAWPCAPTPELPSKDVADDLVDCYLRTMETVYRILHIPTFRKEYEELWVSGTKPDLGFLVQLKLVLALGAITYDDHFSLLPSATRWIYEAQAWISEPKFKARLGIQWLQTNLLLLLGREHVVRNGEAVWILAGSVVRTAIYMGLHRDPERMPRTTRFTAEMRRRIWNTIVEICLQSSLTSGGPPLISMGDFDTAPPGNFDDEQLLAADPVPRPEDTFTQVSVAIALRKTFPLRLAVARFLNDMGSQSSYDTTLRLDAELRTSYKTLRRALQSCGSSSAGDAPSSFALRVVDFTMHRFISSLHIPYFGRALHDSACAFSRRTGVESSLKLWRSVYSLPSSTEPKPFAARNDVARLVLCSSGFFRTVAMQAAMLIGVEVRAQLREEESLIPGPIRGDLLAVLEEPREWLLESIQVAETNIKGYLLYCLQMAQIDGLRRGLNQDETRSLLVETARKTGETCLRILEDKAAQFQPEGALDELDDDASWNVATGLMDGLDFMWLDEFTAGDADAMNWDFNEGRLFGES